MELIGFKHSVFSRAVRIALTDLHLSYEWTEADPFEKDVPLHPFGRVPVLIHKDTYIYETWAILTYLYTMSDDRSRRTALVEARSAQIAGIVQSYAYWPLVRQVYSHGVFRPALGLDHDPSLIDEGLSAAGIVLNSLEEIAGEGLVLKEQFAQEDCMLFPIVDAFVRYRKGAELLEEHQALYGWWKRARERKDVADTFCALEASLPKAH